MAKSSGLGWTTLSVDDSSNVQRDIRNDLTAVDFKTPRAVQDITGIDKFAIERLLLLADFSVTLTGVFNPAANMSHDVFRTVPSTSVGRLVSMTVNGKSLNNTVLFTDYPLTRAANGDLTFKVTGDLSNGAVPTWS